MAHCCFSVAAVSSGWNIMEELMLKAFMLRKGGNKWAKMLGHSIQGNI